ncbi:DEKNAAC105175 [Brettanomyces naardenensis]|uniref:DNA polymerase delta subunit 3 n=1 Tax=Brettanomyces naardenensis TaxID=13370 RepID=A0A448YSQ2_BRENA|nr:DEKNAAC105175 [Brettanomyces naardenensis]
MSLTQETIDFISSELFEEKRPITYRVLSRKLRIPNEASRSLLEEYYKTSNKGEEITPTYILIGTHSHTIDEEEEGDYGDDSGSMLIKLCKLSDLEESKLQFSKVDSCSVYGLSFGDISLSNVVVSNDRINDGFSDELCDICGVIRTPTAGISEVKVEKRVRTVETRKEIVEKVEKKTSVKKEVKQDPFELYRARKAKEAEEKEEAKRNRVVVDEGDGVIEEPSLKRTKVMSKKVKEQEEQLSKMFEDDEGAEIEEDVDLMEIDNAEVDEEGGSIDTPIEEEGKEEKVEELGDKIIDKFLNEGNDKETKEEGNKEEEAVKTYVDDEGYVVAVKNDVKKGGRSSKAGGGSGRKAVNHKMETKKAPSKQSSLMSFFGKRK